MDISVTHDNLSAKDFNPLPRKEGDVFAGCWQLQQGYFNPLPRKEGDLWNLQAVLLKHYFNPLPRKEGDAGRPEIPHNP